MATVRTRSENVVFDINGVTRGELVLIAALLGATGGEVGQSIYDTLRDVVRDDDALDEAYEEAVNAFHPIDVGEDNTPLLVGLID